jgi:hypothetical protein
MIWSGLNVTMPFALAKAIQLSEILAAEVLLLPLNSAENYQAEIGEMLKEIYWSLLFICKQLRQGKTQKFLHCCMTHTEEVCWSVINAWAEAGIVLRGRINVSSDYSYTDISPCRKCPPR